MTEIDFLKAMIRDLEHHVKQIKIRIGKIGKEKRDA